MTTFISPEQLRVSLERLYPPNATCWSQATDEVRDMCRYAREELCLDDNHAVDFRVIKSPSVWNTTGINGIIRFYEQMNERQKRNFNANSGHLWNASKV